MIIWWTWEWHMQLKERNKIKAKTTSRFCFTCMSYMTFWNTSLDIKQKFSFHVQLTFLTVWPWWQDNGQKTRFISRNSRVRGLILQQSVQSQLTCKVCRFVTRTFCDLWCSNKLLFSCIKRTSDSFIRAFSSFRFSHKTCNLTRKWKSMRLWSIIKDGQDLFCTTNN